MDVQSRTSRLNRTQWLLVALLGLIGWLAGFVLQIPVIAVIGGLALLVGLVAAFFGAHKD